MIVVALPICVMCQIIPRTLVKSESFQYTLID